MVLFQGERTEEQKALFKLGLTASNVFYGHKDVAVWLQTEMPSGWAGATHAESGARAPIEPVTRAPRRCADCCGVTARSPSPPRTRAQAGATRRASSPPSSSTIIGGST